MDFFDGKFNGSTVLVFGGCGFIGSNFVRTLINGSPDARVIVFDKLTYSGNIKNLDDIAHLITLYAEMDVADQKDVEHVFDIERPDYVINFAAETHVDRSIHVGSKEFIDTNITGVYNILEACKKYPVKKYVQVSTDEVYGQLVNPHDIPESIMETVEFKVEPKQRAIPSRIVASWMKFNRNSPFRPNVPYSATKAAGDVLCNAYNHTWHIPVCVTHCTNNYGPYQYPEKLVPFWVTRIMNGQKIPVYGDGLNMRDWIHVDDHVTALGAVLLNGVPGETYNIGADNERTNLEMARAILDATGHEEDDLDRHIEYVEDRPGHDRRYAIDNSDIKNELGWEPKYGREQFLEKLKETIVWYITHKEWVEEVITRTGVANPHIDLWKGVMTDDELKEKNDE